MQNKCLRMVLSAPFDTRIADLHRETKIPTVREFVDKITENFYRKAEYHTNIRKVKFIFDKKLTEFYRIFDIFEHQPNLSASISMQSWF